MNEDRFVLAKRQAALCRVMGNAYRLLILWNLAEAELTVSEIVERVGSSMQNISQHLSLLKRRNLISSRRDGQRIYYSLIPSPWLSTCLAITRSQRKSKASPIPMEVLDEHA